MVKIIMLIIGILLTSISILFIILYTNLMVMGYSFLDYVKVISSRVECLIGLLGISMILLVLKKY